MRRIAGMFEVCIPSAFLSGGNRKNESRNWTLSRSVSVDRRETISEFVCWTKDHDLLVVRGEPHRTTGTIASKTHTQRTQADRGPNCFSEGTVRVRGCPLEGTRAPPKVPSGPRSGPRPGLPPGPALGAVLGRGLGLRTGGSGRRQGRRLNRHDSTLARKISTESSHPPIHPP